MDAEKKKDNMLDQLNTAFVDLVGKVFGEKSSKVVIDTQKQIKEFNAKAIKGFVDFTDNLLESTKLKDNEVIRKSSNSVKDLLRQMHLLEEEKEDDF